MLGHPKFTYGDIVDFDMYFSNSDNEKDNKLVTLFGTITIVDSYGTFFDDSDVSYDIYVEGFGLVKHITEKGLRLHNVQG